MVALLFGAIAVTACLIPAKADTYWHLRAGQEIWQTLRVPLDEHYSFTAAGRPWPNHEWLWQALSYGLYRAGGWPLLTAGGAGLVVGALAIAYRLTVGATATRFLLTVLAVPVTAGVWALRPQIVSLLLLAALLALLARERFRWLPLLFVLWANFHGAVALGGLALVAAAAAAVLRARRGDAEDRRRAVVLGLLVPICAIATALTPLGVGLWRVVPALMALSRQTGVDEWQPAYPTGPIQILFWVLAAAFLVLLWRRRRTMVTAAWADQVIVAVALAVLPLAFLAWRNVAPFALVALPAAARLLGPDFRLRWPAKTKASPDRDRPWLNVTILGVFVLFGFTVVDTAWEMRHSRLGWRPLTAGALAAARACPGPLYNRYNEGGFLIWLTPGRRVFVDSRLHPYPLPFLLELIRVEQGAPHQELFARWGIRCALLPIDSPIHQQLRDARWRLLHLDDRFVVMGGP
jgi:hypothetical protein